MNDKEKGEIKRILNPAKAQRRREKKRIFIKERIKDRFYPAEARRRREKTKT